MNYLTYCYHSIMSVCI